MEYEVLCIIPEGFNNLPIDAKAFFTSLDMEPVVGPNWVYRLRSDHPDVFLIGLKEGLFPEIEKSIKYSEPGGKLPVPRKFFDLINSAIGLDRSR